MADEFLNQTPTPDPGGEPSFSEFFQQYRKENPVKTTPFQAEWHSAQATDRYKESAIYSPWIDATADNETAAAQAQSGWEALWNGTKGSWDGIKDGFVSSAMVLPRLVGSIFSGNAEGMMDDEYGMRMKEFEQQQNQNDNPIYMTADERDDIFSLKAAGEMMQNAGYTIGTFAELATETVALEFLSGAFTAMTAGAGGGSLAATTALEGTRWSKFFGSVKNAGAATAEAFKLGKAGETAAMSALRAKTVAQQTELISQMAKLRDVQFGSKLGERMYQFATKIPVAGELLETGNAISLANKTGLLSKGELAKMGLGGLRRAYGEFQAASGEAAIESGGTYNDVYNELYDGFVKKNGYEPDAIEDNRMKELAKNAAVDSYGINMATLLVMNKIEFGNIMRHMIPDNALIRAFKNEAVEGFTVAGKIAGKETPMAFTKGAFGRFGILPEVARTFDNGYRVAAAQFGKGLVSSFSQFSVWEGLQENIQEATVHGLKKHYQSVYDNDPATWGEDFEEAINSQLNKQGLKTFLMGALTGVVTGPLITGASRTVGYMTNGQSYRDQKAENEKLVNSFNAFMKNHANVLSEHIRKTKELNGFGEEMQRAATTEDHFNYLNSRESALMQAVHSAKRLGNLPILTDFIKAYGEGFDNNQFKEAFGFSPEEAGYGSAAEFTGRIAKDIQRYSDTYDHYMKKYSNFLDIGKFVKDPDNKLASDIARAALIDAIEVASFHESKAQDAVKRRAGIRSKLNQYDTIAQTLDSHFEQLTNLNQFENEELILQNEIASLEQMEQKTPETKKMIKQKQAQLSAFQDWMKSIGYQSDEKTGITYDKNGLRNKGSQTRKKAAEAFAKYIKTRNDAAKSPTNVKASEVDAAMQDIVDYMELGEENRRMVDALNMLNDPTTFSRTLQAAENARIGAHARNVAKTTRALAASSPVFARVVKENEEILRSLEQFASSPYATYANYKYLNELQKKLQDAVMKAVVSEEKQDPSKERKPDKESGGQTAEGASFPAQNLQTLMDLDKVTEVMDYVQKHYIFEQIEGNRWSYKRVVDSQADEPVVTHQGEFDLSKEASLDFAIRFETDLFNKNVKGDSNGENTAGSNTEIQKIEDEKEAAIRDEKQKLKWQEGKEVIYNGQSGKIVRDEETPSDSDKVDLITSQSQEIVAQLNKLGSTKEKLDWLVKNKLIEPITIDGKSVPAVDYHDRVMVLVKIGQYNIPFYISTGKAGKKDVKAGEWYAVFGIGSKGWINKGSSKSINEQYGMEIFKKIATILNEGLGNIQSTDENGRALPGFLFLLDEKIDDFNKQMNLPTEPAADNTQVDAFYDHVESTLDLIDQELDGTLKSNAEAGVTTYSIQLKDGSKITLGSGESLMDQYPGLSLAEVASGKGEAVAVGDRVYQVEFTSDDRSTVKIDNKEFTIVRNETTGEISGLMYQTKTGPKVGRNGRFKEYINAINSSLAEINEALAAEDQEALAEEIADLEGNSLEIQATEQILDTIPGSLYFKLIQDEALTPDEVIELRQSLENALNLKSTSEHQGPLMDELEYRLQYDLNKLNAKYPPDEKPNDSLPKDKGPKKATRRRKSQNQEPDDASSTPRRKKGKTPGKNKSKADTLQASVEQLELQFEEEKKDARVQTDNSNVTSVTPVEQYVDSVHDLVTNLLNDVDEVSNIIDFVEKSVSTTKKSTKNSKFVIGTDTNSRDDSNPFDSLGEGVTCHI